MTTLHIAAAALAFGLAFGAAALSQDEWKTVTLNGDPDFTISIPAVVTDYSPPRGNTDGLMYFSVTAYSGGLQCYLFRSDYPQGVTQASLAAGLAVRERREVFCKKSRATVSDFENGGSDSFDHNGQQAAMCLASYTDSAETLPGIVRYRMVVAAPRVAYHLDCLVVAEDQLDAQADWEFFWAEKVHHIQDSLRLPQ